MQDNSHNANGHTLRGCVDWNTTKSLLHTDTIQSHPSWVCGLKLIMRTQTRQLHMSHPSWVCGLKLVRQGSVLHWTSSHPSWVCGLKHIHNFIDTFNLSHTLRGCVDWNLERLKNLVIVDKVTPFVGVWIETVCTRIRETSTMRHTLRGCVEWNRKQILFSEPTWKSHFYENVPLIVNKLQWQKIWFGTSLSGLSLVLYSNL